MFVQGRNNGQWRRGLAYKSGGLGVAGSNPVCPKRKRSAYRLAVFVYLGSVLDLKRSVSRSRACAGFCSGGGPEPDYREAEGKSSLPEIFHRANKISSRVQMNGGAALDKIILQVRCNSAPVIQSVHIYSIY